MQNADNVVKLSNLLRITIYLQYKFQIITVMGLFEESEDWILFQEGDGPDPRGEGGCMVNFLALVFVFLIIGLFFTCS